MLGFEAGLPPLPPPLPPPVQEGQMYSTEFSGGEGTWIPGGPQELPPDPITTGPIATGP